MDYGRRLVFHDSGREGGLEMWAAEQSMGGTSQART